MSQQVINIGQTANDKSGDPLRTAFQKINANFTELYAADSADVQIPAQTGNTGKYLTTNGTTLSWATVPTDTDNYIATSSTSQTITDTSSGTSYTLKIKGVNGTGSIFGIGTGTDLFGIANDALDHTQTGYVPYTVTASTISLKSGSGAYPFTFGTDGNLNVPGHILSQSELHVVGGGLTGVGFNRWTPSTTPGDINSVDFTADPDSGAVIRTVRVAEDQSNDIKVWHFNANGTLDLPTGGTIKQGLQQITIDDTSQTVTIQTGFNNPVYGDFFRTWTFHNNGTIYLPGDSGATIHGETDSVRIYSDTATHNGVDIESNAFTSIVNQNSVIIQTNAGSGTVTKWTFGQDGTITFPDTTHQTTAWTGITNALPSQTGNNGKYLTTNGSGTLSWGTVSGGITASSSDTLTNKTINIQTGQGNTFQIQGNSITSYSGSGSIVPLTSMPTFYGLNTGDSGLTLDGGTGNYYWKPTAFDGTGTIHKSGVYKSSFDADNALFTLGANGAGTMSLAVEGSLFIGNGVPSNSGGLNTNYSGWLVVQAGAKFGGDLNTTGGLHFDNDASGYIQFQNGNVFKVTTVPVHSYGVSGDVAGLMAFDANYIYYCKQAYVNNSTNIWVRVAWSGTTW